MQKDAFWPQSRETKNRKKEIWRIQNYVEIKNHFQITNGSQKKSQKGN